VREPLLLAPLRRLALILSCELTFMISLWGPTVLHLPSLVDCAILQNFRADQPLRQDDRIALQQRRPLPPRYA
jgi:hypothetical protein